MWARRATNDSQYVFILHERCSQGEKLTGQTGGAIIEEEVVSKNVQKKKKREPGLFFREYAYS